MRFAYTILWGMLFVSIVMTPNLSVLAQTNPVLLEAPKPLGDVRSLKRDPDVETFKPVSERTPQELKPVPIRYRGFEISPILTSSQTIDTNIFATSANEETDTITILNPALYVNKNIGRHQANISMEAEGKKYWSNTDEDVLNFNTKIGGFLEARREIKIPFELTYVSGHEKRGQNFSTNFSKKPISFGSFGAALGIAYDPNRLGVSLVGRHGNISFDNGTNSAGQTVVREDGDRNFTDLELSTSYEILPNHRPYVAVNVASIDYENGDFAGGSFTGPKRDSTNFGILAGWQLAFKGLVEGYFGMGYGMREYDDNRLQDIDTFRVASNISWNVTKKATLNLGLRRAITEDNQIVQGIVLSQGKLQFDYEFLHNLYYNAYVDYAFADFQQSPREDEIFSAGTGLRYVINPRFSLSGDYSFRGRDTTALGLDYDRHQFIVRLHSRL